MYDWKSWFYDSLIWKHNRSIYIGIYEMSTDCLRSKCAKPLKKRKMTSSSSITYFDVFILPCSRFLWPLDTRASRIWGFYIKTTNTLLSFLKNIDRILNKIFWPSLRVFVDDNPIQIVHITAILSNFVQNKNIT